MALTRTKNLPSSDALKDSLARAEAELRLAREEELPTAQREAARSWFEGDLERAGDIAEIRTRIDYLEAVVAGFPHAIAAAEYRELIERIHRRRSAHEVDGQSVAQLKEFSELFNPALRSNPGWRARLSPEHFPEPGVKGGLEHDQRAQDAQNAYSRASKAHQEETMAIAELERRRDEIVARYPDIRV